MIRRIVALMMCGLVPATLLVASLVHVHSGDHEGSVVHAHFAGHEADHVDHQAPEVERADHDGHPRTTFLTALSAVPTATLDVAANAGEAFALPEPPIREAAVALRTMHGHDPPTGPGQSLRAPPAVFS